MVDKTSHNQIDRGSSEDDQDSGSHDRNYQQVESNKQTNVTRDGSRTHTEELGDRMEMPEDKVRRVLKIAKEPISMETPIGDDEDSNLGDFIEDPQIGSPIELATGEGASGGNKRYFRWIDSSRSKSFEDAVWY